MNWRSGAFFVGLLPTTVLATVVFYLVVVVACIALPLTGSNTVLVLFSALFGLYLGAVLRRHSGPPTNGLVPHLYARLYNHAVGFLIGALCLACVLMLPMGEGPPAAGAALLVCAAILRASFASTFLYWVAVCLIFGAYMSSIQSEILVVDQFSELPTQLVLGIAGFALLVELRYVLLVQQRPPAALTGATDTRAAAADFFDHFFGLRSWLRTDHDHYGATLVSTLKNILLIGFMLAGVYWLVGTLEYKMASTFFLCFSLLNLHPSLWVLNPNWIYGLPKSRHDLAKRIVFRLVIGLQPLFLFFLVYGWVIYRVQPEDAVPYFAEILWIQATLPVLYLGFLIDFRVSNRTTIDIGRFVVIGIPYFGSIAFAPIFFTETNFGWVIGFMFASFALLLWLGPRILSKADMIPLQSKEDDRG